MELWDACDAGGAKLGYDLVRGEAIPAGCYHAVAEIAVLHADGSVLVTRRDERKPLYPGFWELGAGGSVLKGETWEQGALRELREETGIRAERLEPLFVLSRADNHCIYAGYLCRYDGPKDAVILQEGETVDYRWLRPGELADFLKRDDFVTTHRTRWAAFLRQAQGEA